MKHAAHRPNCGCPDHQPREISRRRALAFSAATTVGVGAYLAGPAAWQWRRAEAHAARGHGLLEQVDVDPGPVDAALVRRLMNTTTSAQAAPMIITYHDIGPQKNSIYTVSAEAFASQMQLLHEAGWTTLTATQVEAWHQGEPLPPRSVLITFDDGCMGVWRYAGPVLRRYGMNAAAFIITGFVGTHEPYYMRWNHIQDLHGSGSWDILAHTHVGHVYVPADAHGGTGPFLTTPQYLPDERRVETQQEFHERVTQDLTECKRQIGLQGFPAPRFFAYPFSAHEADVAQKTVLSLYEGGAMLDDANLIQMTSAEDVTLGLIRRMDITGAVPLGGFVGKLEQASPIDPSGVQPLLDRAGWTDSEQQATNAITIDPDGRALIDPGPGDHVSLQYQRVKSAAWNSYTVSADLGFDADADGTSTGLEMFVGSPNHQVLVSVAKGYYSIFIGDADEPFVAGGLPDGASYHVDLVANTTAISVTVNGDALPVVPLPEAKPRVAAGGIGLTSRRETDGSPLSSISNLVITQ